MRLRRNQRSAPCGALARVAVRILLAAVALALAPPAVAAPIDVSFRGSGEEGLTSESVAAATGALGPTRTPIAYDLFPALEIERGPMSRSGSDPVRGSTTWNVRNTSEESFDQLWLVFRGHNDPADSFYDSLAAGELGLEIDSDANWTLFESSFGTYPAFFLGSVGTSAETELSPDVPVTYLFQGDLVSDPGGTGQLLPKLNVGFATAPIPEPTTVALLGAGLLGLGLAGRRR